MASFDGKAALGNWTLYVSDNDKYIAGTLNCWTLNITCQ
jgi:subtilisin-like proprotein convertase family protein